MRPILASLVHRLANRLIGVALMLQSFGFMIEFPGDWRDRRRQHYRDGITRENWKVHS